MKLGATLVNAAWMAAQAHRYFQFRSALRRPQAAQESLLTTCLGKNAATSFGRQHGFSSIRSVREFQERVPLSSFDDYTASIEQIRSGRNHVLTTSKVRCLEPTSGSTQAAKLIPYTADLQSEFGRAIAPWIVDLALSTPGILGGPAYWSITPALTDSNTPGDSNGKGPDVGFESDSAYLGGWLGWLTNRTLIPCDDLKHARDLREFRRRTLLRLLNERDLRLISVWHPSFLTLLLDELHNSWQELLACLTRGLPRVGPVLPSPGNPKRARELEQADPAHPTTIWPNLALVSCWGDGHAATLIPDLQGRLPGVRIQPKGLIATEAFVSLPFTDRHPLAIRSHFFEFIDNRGNTKLAWELERAESYSVVVTTGGGLYRYQLRDRVTVTDYLEGTPCIRFDGKEDNVSDLCGEKLSEGWVSTILSRLLPEHAPGTSFALLAPETELDIPRYVLYIAAAQEPARCLDVLLERQLSANPNYSHCVRMGQLRPVAVLRVDRSAARRYLEVVYKAGRRLGNIKPSALSAASGWRDILCSA